MTTATTSIAPNVKGGPKPKKKRFSQLFRTNLVAGMDIITDDVFEGVGGKEYLAALFAGEEYKVKRT